ncbi:hypothetical protein [Priestia megaterium]|jgi:hypothetical protein|uniref:hypothetical protein n=1 Tax=Priestia megaterium TaxID=1404 RepID=UPI002A69924E|nr:hypothetical protein [Priestia megaterium]MDY0944196.1 hypothetical protein [Priestia megaterium]
MRESKVGTKIVFSLFSNSADLKEEVNEYIVKFILRLPPEFSHAELIQKAENYASYKKESHLL